MAGRRKPEQLVPSNSLVASAVAYQGSSLGTIAQVYRPSQPWQAEAWRHYDICPELRFAVGWVANAISRCLLQPGLMGPDGVVSATQDASITKAISNFFGGAAGQAEMLGDIARHLTVAGECYAVGRQPPVDVTSRDSKLIWEIVGTNEINTGGGGWTIRSHETGKTIQLGPKDSVIRIWRPHPVNRWEADSTVRALLPTLTEIEYLTLHIFAQTRSRLAGAGVQVWPDTVEFPGSADQPNKAHGLMEIIGKAMATAVGNPGDPSALVPIMVTVPPDSVQHCKEPLHYWSPFDEAAVNSRHAAIGRFCTGFDLPPEIIAGMTAHASSSGGRGTGVSHWGQWQIEESAIKLHIEPVLETIGNALIIGYLRKVTQNANAAFVYFTNNLKLQPDRSKEAGEAYDRGELNGEGLRFYNGLSDDYIPTEDEQKLFILRKMASGSATPEMVAEAANMLGVKLTIPPPDAQPAPVVPQSPSLLDHPRGHALPDTKDQQMLLLTAVSEPLVLRALERAGNRMRNSGIKPPDVPAQEAYLYAHVNGDATKFLEDAWATVAQCSEGIADCDTLTKVLQSYAENLLTEQIPHTREALQRYLTLVTT